MVHVHPAHPYCRNFEANIRRTAGDRWLVVWRDVDTQKQDQEFATRSAAAAFASRLERRVHTRGVDTEDAHEGPSAAEIQRALDFWAG